MLEACRRGDVEAVREFLARGADPNAPIDPDARGDADEAGRAIRPLHAAIEITKRHGRGPGRVATVRLLLDAGADPALPGTMLGVTPLVLAAVAGAPEFIPVLTGAAAPEDLVTVAALADLVAVERLVREHPESAREADGGGWTPLLAASASRLHQENLAAAVALPRIVSLLLADGADPNAAIAIRSTGDAWAALTWATGHADNLPVARVLVAGGAAVDDPVTVFEAAVNERYESLDLLLSRGLDLNRSAAGSETVLQRMLSEPTSRGVEWLLDHGADPNLPGGERRETALHAAARAGCGVRVFQALIRHGAEVNGRNAAGETPLAVALVLGRRRMAALIRDAGGRE